MVDTVLLELEKQCIALLVCFLSLRTREQFLFFSHFLWTTNSIEVEIKEAQCFLFYFIIKEGK